MELSAFLAFLQKSTWNMMLFATAVVTGGMLLWPLVNRLFASSVPHVGVIEAVQMINRRDAIVLDVREASEYAAGHIPNARHIPISELNERIRELDKFKSKPVVVSCQTGTRSARACGTLRKIGFAEVFTLRGGITAWQQAGMPVDK